MAIIKSGGGSDTCIEIDPTFASFMGSYRAPEVGVGGYYRASLNSGTITALAGGAMFFGFQNPSTNLAVVQNVSVGFRAVAGNTSAPFIASMYFTRSYTVIDTTGALAATSFKGQMLTQTRATQLNCIYRIANTSAMSGGTGTDDSQPLNSLVFTHPGAVSTLGNYPMFQQNPGGLMMPTYPVIFAQNEGFRLRVDTTALSGSNTFVAFVDIEWLECTSF